MFTKSVQRFTVILALSSTLFASTHQYWRINITGQSNNAGGFTEVAEWQFYDASNTLIPTTGGVASAQSTQGGSSPNNAFDSDPSTRWINNNNIPTWLEYAFSSPINLDHFTLIASADRPDLCPCFFQLQHSDNNSTWTTDYTYSGAYYPSGNSSNTFYFGGVTYRLTATSLQAGGNAPVVGEWTFNGGAASTSTGTPMATWYAGGGPPSGAFDGSTSTFWAGSLSNTLPVFLSFTFPTVFTLSSITIQGCGTCSVNAYVTNFHVDKSLDGANFTTLGSFTATTWTSSSQSQTFNMPGSITQVGAFLTGP